MVKEEVAYKASYCSKNTEGYDIVTVINGKKKKKSDPAGCLEIIIFRKNPLLLMS